MNTDNTDRALHQVGMLLEEKLKQQILVDNTTSVKGGGDTHKSIKYYKVGELVYVEAAQSFKFVDKGRGPGGVRIREIVNWIEQKGIQPRLENKFTSKTPRTMKSMAFAIANSISKVGTIKRFQYKGSEARKKVYTTQKAKIFNLLAEGFKLDIQAEINNITKK